MNEKMLWQYARLVVEVGINLQKGQNLVINCSVDRADFGRMLTTAAYDAGAKDVIINWRDDYCTREHWLRADDSLFDGVYSWDADRMNTLAKEGAAYIAIAAADPENLKGVDPERQRRYSIASNRDLKDFYSLEMSNGFPWCVASVPIKAWAKKVFPELGEDEAMEKLWNTIFEMVRITEDGDAVEAWHEHCANLERRANTLNSFDLEKVHYKNALGTDLTVELPENHCWLAGGDTSKAGFKFVANMPTEEVFSAPKRDGVNGVLCASKPLVLNGNVVEGIRFEFEHGKIVKASATKGEDVLLKALDTDENSRYLGEIALVPYDSPISNSGIIFYNTLFDENASCHFAFGEAYPSSIKGGDDMTEEELFERGINATAGVHVDFMVGTSDLSITGTTRKGEEVTIFENGNFVF